MSKRKTVQTAKKAVNAPMMVKTPIPMMTEYAARLAFAKKLNQEMRARRWNQSDLARASDTKRAMISNYLKVMNSPNSESLRKIADALSMKPDDLFPQDFIRGADRTGPITTMQVLQDDPSKCFLRINRIVGVDTGAKIISLLKNDTADRD